VSVPTTIPRHLALGPAALWLPIAPTSPEQPRLYYARQLNDIASGYVFRPQDQDSIQYEVSRAVLPGGHMLLKHLVDWSLARVRVSGYRTRIRGAGE
jgi:hypothetical protein